MIKKDFRTRFNLDTTATPEYFDNSSFGFSTKLNGDGVKIAVIDSGRPDHKDITNISDVVNFCEESKISDDLFGHSTVACGIISGNNQLRGFRGIASSANILIAKASDMKGEASFRSIVASVLWAMVKKVDVIYVPFLSFDSNSIVYDVMTKAYNAGIVISVPAILEKNASVSRDHERNFNGAFSSAVRGSKKKTRYHFFSPVGGNEVKPELTACVNATYLENQYAVVSGSSILAAQMAGIMALAIQRKKLKNTPYTPNDIYKEVLKCPFLHPLEKDK